MTTSGPRFATVFNEVAAAPYDDNAWTNHDNMAADDTSYSTITAASFDSGDYSQRVDCTGWGFAIPDGATIDGIAVKIMRYYADGTVTDALVALYNPVTTTESDNKASASTWPTSMGEASYGAADNLWGIAWTAAAINHANFAVRFACVATADNADAFVDYITVTVDYTEAGGTTYYETPAGALTSSGGLVNSARKIISGALTSSGELAVQIRGTIISLDHEEGDLSEYTTTETASGDMSVTADGLAGTDYKLQCVIDDDTSMYGTKEISADTSGIWRARFYFDPNSITWPNSSDTELMVLQGGPTGWGEVLIVKFGKDGSGNYVIQSLVQEDDSGYDSSGLHIIADAVHWIEVEVTQSSGADDGRHRLWIDSLTAPLYDSDATLDNDAKAADVTYCYFGAFGGVPYSAPGGTLYLDELIVNNTGDEIGAIGGGTVYYETPAGALTSSGGLVNSARKVLSGAVTSAGVVLAQAKKFLSGALTSGGAVIKKTALTVAGALTSSGVLGVVKTALLSLGGELTSSGALVNSGRKILSGAVTSAGALINKPGKILSGALTSAGALANRAGKALSGALTSSGIVGAVKTALVSLGGELVSAGAVVIRGGKVLAGVLTQAGTLTNMIGKPLSGAVTSSGALANSTRKVLSGALTSAGTVTKRISKMLAGALSFVGTLIATLGGETVDVPGTATGQDTGGVASGAGVSASVVTIVTDTAGHYHHGEGNDE